MHLQQLLIQYGLIAVLIGSAFEGDFTLILAGVVAHLGIFPFPLAVAAGALGSLAGDSAWYGLGRFRGPRLRGSRLYVRMGPTIERLAAQLGPWQLLAARFVYGTKGASMIFWGLHGCFRPGFPVGARGRTDSRSMALAVGFPDVITERPAWGEALGRASHRAGVSSCPETQA